MLAEVDVLFRTDGHGAVGLGHLRRCLFIAKALNGSLAFAGEFAPEAKELLKSELGSRLHITNPDKLPSAKLSIIDTLFDVKDPEYYDPNQIQAANAASRGHSVLLTSSLTEPPENLVGLVIGHMLNDSHSSKEKRKSGLAYAPCLAPPKELTSSREIISPPANVLLAFGAWEEPIAFVRSLDALAQIHYQGQVSVLLPPVFQTHCESLKERARALMLSFHQNMPSVWPLLNTADLVLCSYGHLAYEAMASGTPLALLNVTEPQNNYADLLERRGFIANLGMAHKLALPQLQPFIEDILTHERLRHCADNARKVVDGKGLERILEAIRLYAKDLELSWR